MEPQSANIWYIAITIMLSLLSAFCAVIGYFLRDIREGIKEKQKCHDEAIEKVKEDLSHFKQSLPITYVLRDDFLRAISNLEIKFDNVAKVVNEIHLKVYSISKPQTGGEQI
ncbi:MAG: hypothetical protein P4N59_10720 [Negativicutes bacterium]|nr:hypothetical protein [Negativicutes bacterium]